jgi:protein gp37
MILTKQPKRLAEFARWYTEAGKFWPQNLICGTSVTTQVTTSRIADLLKVPGRLFISAEPLWEQVDLGDLSRIDLVITGGQSGKKAKPCDLAWLRSVRDQCRSAGVACFVKQLGSHPRDDDGRRLQLRDSHGGDWSEWPADLQIREFPRAAGQTESAQT